MDAPPALQAWWFERAENVRVIDEMERMAMLLRAQRYNGMRSEKGERALGNQITALDKARRDAMRQAGFLAVLDKQFADFYRNWKPRYDNTPPSVTVTLPSGTEWSLRAGMIMQLKKQAIACLKRLRGNL